MKNVLTALASGAFVLGLTTAAFAQTETAIAYATRINACNDAPIVAARYLATGQLEVTCPPGAVTGAGAAPAALAGTGLGTGATVGLLGAVAVLAIASGGSDGVSTTTTTASSE